MSPGNQVSMTVIDNGVVVQHQPIQTGGNIVGISGEQAPQGQQKPVAKHMGTLEELCAYLKSLELFQDEA